MTIIETLLLYLVTYFLSVFFLSFYKKKNRYVRNVGMFISILIPSILAGIRNGVGTDFYNYDYIFTLVRKTSWSDIFALEVKWEKGFIALTKLLGMFGDNSFIFGVLTFITLAILINTLMQQYKEFDLITIYSIYFFQFYFSSLNIVRQLLVISIILYAYKYIYKKQFIKFLLFVLLGMQIHYSAIIAIIMYFLWDGEKNTVIEPKKILPLVLAGVIFVVSWRNILVFLKGYVPWLNKYAYLLNDNNANNRDIFVKIVFLVLFIFLWRYYKSRDTRLLLFIYSYILCVIIGFTGFQITYIKRLGIYFEIAYIILLGTVPQLFKYKSSRPISKMGVILISFIYFYLSAFILGQSDLVPYDWRIL